MECSTAHTVGDLPEPIRRALIRNNNENFFNSYAWYETFGETCLEAGAKPLFVYGIGERLERPPFVFVALRTPAHQPGSKLPAAVPRSGSVASMTNYQSSYFAPVIDEGGVEGTAAALLAEVFRTQLRQFGVLDFNYCDPRCNAAEMLADAAENAGFAVTRCAYRPNVFGVTKGKSFQEYLAERPGMLKNAIRRKEKALTKTHAIAFQLYDDDKDIDNHIAAYEAVQAASWKNAEPFAQFTRTILRKAASAGALRLSFLTVDGAPVATQVWIVSGKFATIYKTHYRSDYAKHGVGSILRAKMFQHAIDIEHIEEIDFGVGDEPYKSDWLSNKRDLESVVAFNRHNVQGIAANVAYATSQRTHAALRYVKSAVRKTLAKTQ